MRPFPTPQLSDMDAIDLHAEVKRLQAEQGDDGKALAAEFAAIDEAAATEIAGIRAAAERFTEKANGS